MLRFFIIIYLIKVFKKILLIYIYIFGGTKARIDNNTPNIVIIVSSTFLYLFFFLI